MCTSLSSELDLYEKYQTLSKGTQKKVPVTNFNSYLRLVPHFQKLEFGTGFPTMCVLSQVLKERFAVF